MKAGFKSVLTFINNDGPQDTEQELNKSVCVHPCVCKCMSVNR